MLFRSVMSRYTERPTYEHFKEKIERLREERLEENPLALLGTGLRLASSAAGRQVLKRGAKSLAKKALKTVGKAVFGDGEKDKSSGGDAAQDTSQVHPEKAHASAKTASTWEHRPTSDPVYQSKLKQASIAPIKENKISDIRSMIKEGVDNMRSEEHTSELQSH